MPTRTHRRQHPRRPRVRARPRTNRRKTPEAHPHQAHHAQQLYDAGTHTVQRIADLLQVPRSTIYGHLNKASIGRRPAGNIHNPA
ncbi:helix-turn-helix domain-containing protein [Corynebacterium propinquum]|uniref:Helix-turn-helix domain-containing protein n=1 Tax=Corynebacterium propinquum TaxID=43769 RepID=A0ABT7G146_9CORY|nr:MULTISPECIES: helix-turn-helix domain-containing protein [Corynebacterium]MDK4300455.1 helix-turn-helix domain-containing protein [Corynebacterium propinquum]MDK4312791.1 helix-turn-helix domain-containing protein [Corynebacterium propinquum]MDK4327378.1 helix-turn-helix domain-containing protein [Corynebacterium pseudodiphtheriticum]